MNDDFNTAEAIAVLFELARETNKARTADAVEAEKLAATLRYLGGVLGLLQADAEDWLKGRRAEVPVEGVVGTGAVGSVAISTGYSDEKIDELIQQRLEARKNKDWATADRIRNELKEQSIVLEDTAGGTTWRRI
jgi:cysteinyl-tRNA synthetase